MSDWTPTEEQVRITFVERTRSAATGTSRADQEAAFNRWLAAHDEAVRAEERERIVSALREKFGVTNRAADWIAREGA